MLFKVIKIILLVSVLTSNSYADVIVNKYNSLNEIDKGLLYDIITGRVKYYENGARVNLVTLPKSHKAFVRLASMYGFSPIQLQRIMVYIGQKHRTRVLQVDSELAAVNRVQIDDGGIGYVLERYSGVKNLEVND